MNRFLYTAWFRDSQVPVDDQDYEWPACFVVEASNPDDARSWGDHLAHRYAEQRPPESFLSSAVEPAEPKDDSVGTLPVVVFGREASDAEIGW